jgi:hypothetical protein
MKKIYLIGFRGTGFQDRRYVQEAALIRAGHVGFAFEGDETQIFGFHPTPEAIETVGSDEAAIEWLKAKKPLDGRLQNDYEVFARAAQLALQGARTQVFQLAIEVSDEEFERIHERAKEWYNQARVFQYAFPSEPLAQDRGNCATFPRRLGLPLLDPIGQIKDYVRVLEQRGEMWRFTGA